MIPATAPTNLEAVYDRWTISGISQAGDGCADVGKSNAGKIRLTVTLVKFRLRPDGVSERSPLHGDTITVVVDDLYAEMASNSVVADAMNSFVAGVVNVAQSKSLL